MPFISRFFGIVIFMNFSDHNPPHFHARYQDFEILMEIVSGVHTGFISPKGLELIQEWRKLHIDELLEDWELASQRKELKKIKPLE